MARVLVFLALVLCTVVVIVYLVNRRPPAPFSGPGPAGPTELERTNLVLTAGRLCPAGSTIPFTGVMLEHYPTGALRSRSVISNGILHGLSQGWFTNGQMQVSEMFREGVSHGLRTKWYAAGTTQSLANIVDGKLQGPFRRWHENGIVSEQVEFVADKPEGESLSFYPSGYLKARVVMKDGKPVEQQYYKDGERKL